MIVHGYDMGVAHDGGYAEHVRVPADWVVRRPESMTAFDAMTLGTAGYTAALAIELMQHNGLTPENGPVAVTGATGGVGSVGDRDPGQARLSRGRDHRQGRGGELPEGASAPRKSCCGSRSTSRRSARSTAPRGPAPSTTWAATSCRGSCRRRRSAAPWPSVGLAAGYKLNTTVMPFILRGVHLLGVDSAETPMALRQTHLEQARGRMAARPRARPGAHHRLRRAAHALRSVPQGPRARAHRRAHRAGHARRLMSASAAQKCRPVSETGIPSPLARRPRRVLARAGRAGRLADAVHVGARLLAPAVRALVRRRAHQPLPQRGRPPPRRARRPGGAGLHLDRDRARRRATRIASSTPK